MIKITKLLKFDVLRLVIRNKSFLFFTLLMPAVFYLLFTKVMLLMEQKRGRICKY